MCGIVGYVGHRSCLPILIEGLKRLEYRGYDSAGVRRAAGRQARRREGGRQDPSKLESRLLSAIRCRDRRHRAHALGTHGEPNDNNAQSAQRPAPASWRWCTNGIIENYRAFKSSLEAEGNVSAPQTDTEVLAQPDRQVS
jgi:glucosamine--fructose-6-phosphate aminotransferase (isomerizing)